MLGHHDLLEPVEMRLDRHHLLLPLLPLPHLRLPKPMHHRVKLFFEFVFSFNKALRYLLLVKVRIILEVSNQGVLEVRLDPCAAEN